MRIPLYLLLLLLFFKTSTLLILVASSQDPSPSLLALLDIKSSLQGSPSSLADWTFSGGAADNFSSAESYGNDRNPWCTWRGIKCDAGTGEVVSLDLSSGNFTGQIPEKIRQLTHLKELNLSRNKFSGPFPAAILSLTSLESLDISRNTFNSTFPPEITRLQSLTYLNTYSNNFGGPLPPELSGLGGLDYLSLGGSEFTGSVPRSYGQLRNLKFLYLAGNKLTGAIPPELGSLNQLWWLEIGYNNFTGGIPPELGQATNLSYLSLADTGLSGPIPPEIGNLTKLETLFLFQNRLSGEIPRSFGNLRALSNLDMSQNRLTGTIPLEFGLLESLASINLMSNELYGEVPPGIAELPHLAIVWLWKNRFTGELPQSLGSNGKVAKVDASSNAFSGPIPPGLCNGNKLVRLILFGNQFSGPIPPALANCTSLTRLRIQDNRLNGSIPRGFGGSPDLAFVDLSNNRLSGKIPEDLLAGASYLNISGNAFDSELPESIWRSPTLQVFSASASSLVGTIPSFAGCKNVYKIELAGNSLNGSIPWDVDSCRKLITLLLARNSLTGSIPWEISALPSIADVDLSQNLLTGGIPRNFSNCNTVENFNVSYNNLSGPIPSTCTVFSNLHHSSFAGNEGLCGGTFLKPCDAQGTGDADRPRRTAGKVLWIMAAAFGVGLFVLVAGSQWLRRRGYGDGGGGGGAAAAAGPWRLTAFQRLNFTAEDVAESVTATDTIVGMGTHGTVYRAEMPGGEIIAVKKLWGQSKEASAAGAAAANHNSHHHRRWQRGGGVQAEVEVLGHVRHRNIVRMIGYCGNSEYTMLLYEYMPNGSLEDLLHGRKKGENLVADWLTRYKIALGVAQGICYLHHDCDPVIVHRDLKPSNILLDAEMEARVADFGVAKLIQSNEAMSVVAGSYGYIAPEYTYTLQVNEKSDIYSYGVVLMEILSGKRCSDSEFGEGNSIVDWVRQKVRTKDGLGDVLDKNVGASCDAVREEMVLVLRVALLCTSRNPADRPSMRDVVSMLQEAKPESKLTGGGTDFGRGGGNTNTVYNVSVIGEGGGDGSSPLFQKSSSLSEC